MDRDQLFDRAVGVAERVRHARVDAAGAIGVVQPRDAIEVLVDSSRREIEWNRVRQTATTYVVSAFRRTSCGCHRTSAQVLARIESPAEERAMSRRSAI